MPESKRVLLVGESWATAAPHYKGFDQFASVTFHLGAEPLVEVLKASPFHLTYMPGHEAARDLSFTLDELRRYDAVVLSDIGSNSLLLHPDVWLSGKPAPNRLKLIRDWTSGGGGLLMVGGCFGFQGVDGRARWRGAPVEEALPVKRLPYDDRIEAPEVFKARLVGPRNHPIPNGLSDDWPLLLGASQATVKEAAGAEVLAALPEEEDGHPLLVVGGWGEGRACAWTSDSGPHWVPPSFVAWPGYAQLWRNVLAWLTRLS